MNRIIWLTYNKFVNNVRQYYDKEYCSEDKANRDNSLGEMIR